MSSDPKVECSRMWNSWPSLVWYLGSICLPIAIPWFIYKSIISAKYANVQKALQGKVVLITGASSGLGEALAHSLYKVGCKLILASRREEELNRVRNVLLQTRTEAQTFPPVVLPLDLSNVQEMEKSALKILSIFGRIDILINNAGITHRGRALSTNIDVDMRIMQVNYFGQVALTKALLPSMVKQKSGHIVVISSIQGLIGIPHRSAYAASKHALQGFFDGLRAELADDNIKVTVASPGYIQTKLSLNALRGDGKVHGKMDEATASGYAPEIVAELIMKGIVSEQKEMVISTLSPRIAIFLRKWWPTLYFYIMQVRARNQD